MNEAIFNQDEIIDVGSPTLDDLKQRAQMSPRGRFRLCLHHDTSAAVQEMIIVCRRGTYVRPHRHPPGNTESYHVIEGEMTVYLFDDDGKVTRRIEMGQVGSGKSFLYRIACDVWHLPVPTSDVVVYHEVYSGPFDKEVDVCYASWSPDDSDPQVVADYLDSLTTTKGR